MALALLAIGLVLAIAAYNDQTDTLTTQLQKDFSGKTGFIYWIAALVIVGSIGFVKPLQPVSRAFLALILLVLFLTNKGVFAQFNNALAGGDGGQSGNGAGQAADAGAGGANATGSGGAGNTANNEGGISIVVGPWRRKQ